MEMGSSVDSLESLSGTGIICRDPLVLCTIPLPHLPVGIAGPLAKAGVDRPSTVLLSLWWSHENPDFRNRLIQAIKAHQEEVPQHNIVVLCNTNREVDLITVAGVRAVFCNHNIFVSEERFVPLPGSSIEFDAVYNARLISWKRHHLAFEIPRVAYICYQAPNPTHNAEAVEILGQLASRAPAHVVINPIVEERPRMVLHDVVNLTCNRSAVGLCLSAEEGAMFASIEYLLAGLPIVSTPSIGGRDVFFRSEYCLIVPPIAGLIRQAAAWLRQQAFSREYIRERTLAHISRERERFLSLLDAILIEAGSTARFVGNEWPFAMMPRLVSWKSVAEHLRDIVAEGGHHDSHGGNGMRWPH